MRTRIKTILTLAAGLGMFVVFEKQALGDHQEAPPPAANSKSGGLFPNDFGPAEIDVSAYPKEYRQTYRIFAFKCAACHTIARPINSQYLELTEAELKKAKAESPELFADQRIVQAESGVWNRYVKRMMSKPGCPVGKDGKAIWEFLVYDSKIRKMGANAKAWREHRARLLREFKEHYGDVYRQLFGDSRN